MRSDMKRPDSVPAELAGKVDALGYKLSNIARGEEALVDAAGHYSPSEGGMTRPTRSPQEPGRSHQTGLLFPRKSPKALTRTPR